MHQKKWKEYVQLLVKLGVSMIVSICIFFFIGLFLDNYFSFNGVLIIVCTFLGVGVGFYTLYFQLKRFF